MRWILGRVALSNTITLETKALVSWRCVEPAAARDRGEILARDSCDNTARDSSAGTLQHPVVIGLVAELERIDQDQPAAGLEHARALRRSRRGAPSAAVRAP